MRAAPSFCHAVFGYSQSSVLVLVRSCSSRSFNCKASSLSASSSLFSLQFLAAYVYLLLDGISPALALALSGLAERQLDTFGRASIASETPPLFARG